MSLLKILIVEDEKPISDLFRMNLSDAGYVCECVFDGMRAADYIFSEGKRLETLAVKLQY